MMRSVQVLVIVGVCAVCAHGATEYNLAYQGAIETVNGVVYMQWDEPKPMGTGLIGAFLGMQGTTGNPQRGYNTNGTREFDTKPGCRTLLLSDIPVWETGGVYYREFLLDINQNVTHNLLSLDDLQVFLETTDSLSGYPGCFSAPIYDLDTGGDNYVKLNDDFGAGSGKGDMLLFVPDSLFTGAENYNSEADNYIYLYSMFGDIINGADGFEEWAIGEGGTIIPEPATIFLLGLSALLLRRCRG